MQATCCSIGMKYDLGLVKLELACMNGDDGGSRKLHHPSFLAFCCRRQHPSALGSGSRSVLAACTHNKNVTPAFVVKSEAVHQQWMRQVHF